MKKIKLLLFIVFTLVNVVLQAQESLDHYMEQGRNHYKAGELDAAIKNFETAKKLAPELPKIWWELGNVYLSRGDYDTAIENYNQAVKIYIEWEDERAELAELYAKRGEAYDNKGNYDAVIADFSQAIRLDGKDAMWRSNRGEAYRKKGDYDSAIKDFLEAVKLDKDNADAWNNLGLAYYGKTDYDKAIVNYNIAINLDNRHAQAWNNRGAAYLEKNDYDRAIADYTKLIEFKTNYDYAIVYSNRSRAYRMKKEYKNAVDDCDRALKIDRNYAPALNNRAQAYFEMGEYKKALDDFKACINAAEKSINMNDISVYAWYLAGQVYEKFPYLKGGIKNNSFWSKFVKNIVLDGISRGVKNAENIRQNLGTQGAELMARMICLYYAGVDFEAAFGSAEKVFFYSESLRSRGFLEQVGTEAAIRLAGVSEDNRKKFMRLRATIDEQQAIVSTYNREKQEGETDKKFALAIRERKKAEEELAELDKELGKNVPKYTELRNPKPVTLSQAKAYCGKDRAVLEYVLWDNSAYKPVKGPESWSVKGESVAVNSYCLVITKNGLTAVPLATGFDYHNAIEELRNCITAEYTSATEYEKARNVLYDQLIKPVLPYLKNIKNITIVPDGELAKIPYDVLRTENNSKSFGESYVISLSPSLSVSILANKEGSVSYSPILFFANDKYEGRKNNYGGVWKNLDGVNDEIKELIEIARGQKKEFSSYLGENATKKQLLSANIELQKYNIIHFACHGYFDPINPANSGLVLYQISGDPVSEDGYLTIPEVATLELNARMVILSACETGLGEVKIGEGMIGLVRAFMVAGARNVGVSLWEIDDKATVPFMKSLYQKVLERGGLFRESYKEVKEIFITGVFGIKYARPRYWAAFTIYE